MFLKKEKSLMLFDLNIWEKSTRGVALFFGVYVFATLFAALLTPPTYWLAQWADGEWRTDTTRWLVGKGVHSFYDRLRWIPIILALPWILKTCGLISLRNLGLSIESRTIKKFFRYFILGVLVAVFIYALQVFMGGAAPAENLTFSKALRALLGGLFSAMIVGLLEEVVFRALIMRSFYTAWGVTAGVVLSSAFFAYKHFKVSKDIFNHIEGGVLHANWDTGFIVAYYDTMGVFLTFDAMKFGSLMLFGVALCLLYIFSRTLASPIAFHAGIVWMLLSYKTFFDTSAMTPEAQEIYGTRALTDGWAALWILAAFCAFLYYRLRRRQKLRLEYY